jgi:hypothetical protein
MRGLAQDIPRGCSLDWTFHRHAVELFLRIHGRLVTPGAVTDRRRRASSSDASTGQSPVRVTAHNTPANVAWEGAAGRTPTGWIYPFESLLLVGQLEQLQDLVMQDAVGGAWPACPEHRSHPLVPRRLRWVCLETRTAARPEWAFGEPSSVSAGQQRGQPICRDGQVRWYQTERGWGVTAHRDGDLYVPELAVPSGWEPHEGDMVGFRLRTSNGVLAMQGLLRQAETIWPLEPTAPLSEGTRRRHRRRSSRAAGNQSPAGLPGEVQPTGRLTDRFGDRGRGSAPRNISDGERA